MIEGQLNEREQAPATPSLTELEAADQLIAENELLKDNPRVKFLRDNNFVTEDGRQLDAGNFLAAMVNYIESQEPGSLSQEAVSEAAQDFQEKN